MRLQLLPANPPKRVSRTLKGRQTIELWEYVLTRRRMRLDDLAVSNPDSLQLVPYPVFGESTCYLTPHRAWQFDELDDNQLLLRILEHETIHDILMRDQNFWANMSFDQVFNTDPGHWLAPSEILP